jgi:K+-transporting ATPase ATPase A chain
MPLSLDLVILKTLAFLLAALIPAPFLASYMAKVYRGDRHPLSFLKPIERAVLRTGGVDPKESMSAKEYLFALLSFNALGFVVLYLILLLQGILPFNPRDLPGLSWHSAFNVAVSFVTNTNWQSYSGETTMSHLSQSLGLVVQNFASAATGMSLAVLVARVFGSVKPLTLFDVLRKLGGVTRAGELDELEARHRGSPSVPSPLGNFWVDLVRSALYILLPLSLAMAVLLASQGLPQSFRDYAAGRSLEGEAILVPSGPVASQIAIKQLGSNGGGFFGANSAHPYENPTPLSNFLETIAILLIPAAFPLLFGELTGRRKQGLALFGAMAILFALGLGLTLHAALAPNPSLGGLPGLEGIETRFGRIDSAIWTASTTAVSNGSVNSMLDSAPPLAVLAACLNIMLGEVVFGGVGAGLYGLFLFAILAVFIAGLMVGRGPEYIGRKIEAREVRLAMIGILAPSAAILAFSALALTVPAGRAAILNAGPRGFSEVLYAFSSAAGNNGSALAGLGTSTTFYDLLLGIAMLIGRYGVILPVAAIAGSLAAKRRAPEGAGTLRTDSPSFAFLLAFVVLIVGGLTFFPALALGPIAEALLQARGALF